MLTTGCGILTFLVQTVQAMMTVNAQVLNELKKIDEGSLIDYLEVGLSVHRGVYKVPQDDL